MAESFFSSMGEKLRTASQSLAPTLEKARQSASEAVDSLTQQLSIPKDIYVEDPALQEAMSSIEEVRHALVSMVNGIDKSKVAMIAAADAQRMLGETLSSANTAHLELFERYIPNDGIMMQLSLGAAEISSSNQTVKFIQKNSEECSKLQKEFNDSYNLCMEMKKKYVVVKTEYLKQKKILEGSSSTVNDPQAVAKRIESLKTAWTNISTDLLPRLETLSATTAVRMSNFVSEYALSRLEVMTKIAKNYIDPAEQAKHLTEDNNRQ